MNNQPILIIDNDNDDYDILQEAWQDLEFHNELIFFQNSRDVLKYLKEPNSEPFMMFCDVNMFGMDGFELREAIIKDRAMHRKSVPFIFWSTFASNAQIQKAYDLGVQGFFVKENNYEAIKQSLVDIVHYWTKSKTPAIN